MQIFVFTSYLPYKNLLHTSVHTHTRTVKLRKDINTEVFKTSTF